MDRERVSLSLKATQEDPWQQFARTHAIGQVVPGKVTKLVPFGAFVRVDEGIEGLVHISELAERHVEIPEQVVNVGDEIFVKVIDIDLERRRISLSLKQANEGTAATEAEFDPTLYGMAAEYDERGQLHLPRGLRPGDQRVARGLRDAARDVGEAVRRGARALGGAPAPRSRRLAKADAEARGGSDATVVLLRDGLGSGRRRRRRGQRPAPPAPASEGTLASDEALAALREKLTGN